MAKYTEGLTLFLNVLLLYSDEYSLGEFTNRAKTILAASV